jgi:NADPH:quinone reductase-like Zn-dependent oxidoreductase
VRSLGADRVIDYAQEDFATGSARYDIILDLAGNHAFSVSKRVLTPHGIHVGAGVLAEKKSLFAMFGGLIGALLHSRFSSQKFVVFMAKVNREDLAFVGGLVANGRLKPVIDKKYSLVEVPEAIRYQGTWRARGKLVIDLQA